MIVTLFRSELRSELSGTQADEAYREANRRMVELASGMPGFVSVGRLTDTAGAGFTVVVFDSEEAHAAWRAHPEHRQAQRRGREQWYENYSVEVLTPIRSYSFSRKSGRSGDSDG